MRESDPNERSAGLSAPRKRVEYRIGTYVQQEDGVYRILAIHDFETATGVHVETGRSKPLRLNGLDVVGSISSKELESRDMEGFSEGDLAEANRRLEVISPFLGSGSIGRAEVAARAKEFNVDQATLYRWLKRYRSTGVLESLIPLRRGWKAGRYRLDLERGRIIDEVIKDYYLSVQRPSAQKAILEIARRCLEHGLVAPSGSAIRLRLSNIPEKLRLKGRGQKEKAANIFNPVPGKFPNANFPLSVVQIDHTPVDLILVDDIYRRPVGRPWLTLAFDVYSRVVTGYYLSFDPPSETSVAMCVSHSILQKEDWLALHQVDAKWPVWGIPQTIHVDNGADFRSENFKNSCGMYNIHLEYRPVKQPRFGGHIERMLGTLAREIHALPGTTFSSIKERDSYDSEKHASMTKSEFEKWLVTLICNVYHQRIHSSIGVSPLKQWDIGIFGNAEIQGTGLPPTLTDRLRVLLDFLPSFQRTIQPIGVTIEGLTYYDDCLRHRINEFDRSSGSKRTFVFRRDPRDISYVWFYDPDSNEYYRVPVADLSIPSMSMWEFKKVKEILRKEGISSENKVGMLRVLNDLRSQVAEASAKTKKARRQAQRRREHEKAVSPACPLPTPPTSAVARSIVPMASELIDGDLAGFGDIA